IHLYCYHHYHCLYQYSYKDYQNQHLDLVLHPYHRHIDGKYHRNIERDIDRFDDIFHQYGDDMDEEQDPNVDFDNLY
ncbi:unnamed protein product, partial [Rotaria sp. Silwood2]